MSKDITTPQKEEIVDYPFSNDDYLRILDLLSYDILDTEKEDVFTQLAESAADFCHCPMALIGFIEQDRHWIKASHGIEISELDRSKSLCAHTIMSTEPLIVPDLTKDPRFKENPFVKPDDGLRFYAGVPILTPGMHAIGAVCVLDKAPGVITKLQIKQLQELAQHIQIILETRKSAQELYAEWILGQQK